VIASTASVESLHVVNFHLVMYSSVQRPSSVSKWFVSTPKLAENRFQHFFNSESRRKPSQPPTLSHAGTASGVLAEWELEAHTARVSFADDTPTDAHVYLLIRTASP
jgi:hypothetical protein